MDVILVKIMKSGLQIIYNCGRYPKDHTENLSSAHLFHTENSSTSPSELISEYRNFKDDFGLL